MRRIYSGTTTQNFLDASFEQNGNLYYQKERLRNKTLKPNALFYNPDLFYAIDYAILVSYDLKDKKEIHKPLILCGKTEEWPYIQGSTPFRLDSVWILKNPHFSIEELESVVMKAQQSQKIKEEFLKDKFEEKDPINVFHSLSKSSLFY